MPPCYKRRGMRDLLAFSLLSLSAVFFVVDPLGVVPIFLAVTQGDSDEKKALMARRASITAFCILTVFAVAGTVIFRILGVTLGAFKVAGGVLLMLTAIHMLRAQPARSRRPSKGCLRDGTQRAHRSADCHQREG